MRQTRSCPCHSLECATHSVCTHTPSLHHPFHAPRSLVSVRVACIAGVWPVLFNRSLKPCFSSGVSVFAQAVHSRRPLKVASSRLLKPPAQAARSSSHSLKPLAQASRSSLPLRPPAQATAQAASLVQAACSSRLLKRLAQTTRPALMPPKLLAQG